MDLERIDQRLERLTETLEVSVFVANIRCKTDRIIASHEDVDEMEGLEDPHEVHDTTDRTGGR